MFADTVEKSFVNAELFNDFNAEFTFYDGILYSITNYIILVKNFIE